MVTGSVDGEKSANNIANSNLISTYSNSILSIKTASKNAQIQI